MRYVIILFTLCAGNTIAAEIGNVYSPSHAVSHRCQVLLKKHEERTSYRQKLMALIARNKRLQKITPPQRLYLTKKLKENMRNLEHKMQYIRARIEHHQEDIIRKGCPIRSA